jgi:hypothetical protein
MFWNDLAFAHNGKKENPTDTPDSKFLGELEKELLSTGCKMLDGKNQKSAEVH